MAMITSADDLKTLRETLCVAQQVIGQVQTPRWTLHTVVLQNLIDDIDEQRPLGADGKHGDRHTPTCGCIDVPQASAGKVDHAAEAMKWFEEAEKSHWPEHVARAQFHAQMAAFERGTDALVEQQRIGNKLRVALVDQMTEIAKMTPLAGYPVDPAIVVRDYLSSDEWAELNL